MTVSFFIVASLTLGLLSLHSTIGSSLENGRWRKLNVLLGGDSHHVGWDVHELLSNSDVSLSDHDPRVVKASGKVPAGDLGLQSSLQELSDCESEDVKIGRASCRERV